jgi:uncharacterized membrane protein (DUF4010 family)
VRFVVLALLILPFLPDTPFGPFAVLNPKEIGWVVLLTSGFGFLGYILIKTLGTHRGILLGGLLGGLVSSTSITWIYARKSKENPSLSGPCATAILGASTILFFRVGLWTALFSPLLFRSMAVYLLLLLLISMASTFFTYSKSKGEKAEENASLHKPLDLVSALVFGGIYMGILLGVSYANDYFGDQGTLLSSAIAGLADIDAVSISVAKLSGTTLSISLAELSLLLACLSNTLVKLLLGSYLGSPQLRTHLLIGYSITGLSCLLVILYLLTS